MRSHSTARGRWCAAGIGAAWIVALSAGWVLLTQYQMTPGPSQASAASWPAGMTDPRLPDTLRIQLDRELPTLLMFVHPQCPCSSASVEELARLMARRAGAVKAHVLFYKPQNEPAGWAKSSLWDSVAAIPGVTASIDHNATTARRFGARTSGQVMLYDRTGRLLFRGGITGSRGHAGDNAGLEAVEKLLDHPNDSPAQISVTPVFGCELY